MLLSVVVYNHKLTAGQWAGAGIVFAGISVEAWVKRTGKGTSKPRPRPQAKLTTPSRGPRETRGAGEGESKDQGTITRPWTIRWTTILSLMPLYLSLFNHSHPIAIRLPSAVGNTCVSTRT